MKCEVFCGKNKLNKKVYLVCASDLMSDVLDFSKSGEVLLTAKVNMQTYNTA